MSAPVYTGESTTRRPWCGRSVADSQSHRMMMRTDKRTMSSTSTPAWSESSVQWAFAEKMFGVSTCFVMFFMCFRGLVEEHHQLQGSWRRQTRKVCPTLAMEGHLFLLPPPCPENNGVVEVAWIEAPPTSSALHQDLD